MPNPLGPRSADRRRDCVTARCASGIGGANKTDEKVFQCRGYASPVLQKRFTASIQPITIHDGPIIYLELVLYSP